jgi:hypothetical protein
VRKIDTLFDSRRRIVEREEGGGMMSGTVKIN